MRMICRCSPGIVHPSPPRGVAVVEFALVLIPLLLLVFGIVNFGALMYDQSVITNAAREGARWAAIRSSATLGSGCTNTDASSPADPCQVAYNCAHNRLISFNGNRSPVVTYAAANGYATGAPQAVTVTYSYKGIGYFFGLKGLSTFSATSVMLHE